MSCITQEHDLSPHVVPSVQRLSIINLPFGRLLRHQVNDFLHEDYKDHWISQTGRWWAARYLGVFVEAGKVLLDVFMFTGARPALFDISDRTFGFGHERDNIQLFVAGDREDEEMSVLCQPCDAVTWEGPS